MKSDNIGISVLCDTNGTLVSDNAQKNDEI